MLNERKNSCLKVLALMEAAEGYLNLATNTFEGKINVSIIFGLLLVSFLDLEIMQLIISTEKFISIQALKIRKFEMIILASADILFRICGPRED